MRLALNTYHALAASRAVPPGKEKEFAERRPSEWKIALHAQSLYYAARNAD